MSSSDSEFAEENSVVHEESENEKIEDSEKSVLTWNDLVCIL